MKPWSVHSRPRRRPWALHRRAWALHCGVPDGPPNCVRPPVKGDNELHCICGASLWLIGFTREGSIEARLKWIEHHRGPGHRRCSTVRAWNERKRQRRAKGEWE